MICLHSHKMPASKDQRRFSPFFFALSIRLLPQSAGHTHRYRHTQRASTHTQTHAVFSIRRTTRTMMIVNSSCLFSSFPVPFHHVFIYVFASQVFFSAPFFFLSLSPASGLLIRFLSPFLCVPSSFATVSCFVMSTWHKFLPREILKGGRERGCE